jgi:transketolase
MQKAYILKLYEIMMKDARVCSLLSDSGTDYDLIMNRELPRQCFNFGIAEQNKVAAASGMAAMGKIPFVYTTGAFLAYRAYEFIRDDICMQNRNVKIIGMGTGIVGWPTLGPSHHTTEDIAALRVLPNLVLLSAATPRELSQIIQFSYEHVGAVYVRIGMSSEEELYPENYSFSLGILSKLHSGGRDIAIYTTGAVAAEAYHAAVELDADCYNIPPLKPLNTPALLETLQNKRQVFSVEEHQTNGGLGGIIAEIMTERGFDVPLVRIGLDDHFAAGYGTAPEIRKMNGLDRESVRLKIVQQLSY